MGKYYLYNGKQVGFVRKAIDEVVLVEDGWISEVQNHFGKKTHDKLLEIPAVILKNSGFPEISRAQAWIILLEVLKGDGKGVPESLRDGDVDEEVGKGSLLKDIAKNTARAGATVVDTATGAGAAAAGAVVGGTVAAAGAAASVVGKTAEVAADVVEDAADAIVSDEDGADGEGSE